MRKRFGLGQSLLLIVVFVLLFPLYSVKGDPERSGTARITVKADYHHIVGTRLPNDAPERVAVFSPFVVLLALLICLVFKQLPCFTCRAVIRLRLKRRLLRPIKYTSKFLIIE